MRHYAGGWSASLRKSGFKPGQNGNGNKGAAGAGKFNADPNAGGNGSGDQNGNGRLSSKQHNYILKLAGEKGLTQSALNQKCKV